MPGSCPGPGEDAWMSVDLASRSHAGERILPTVCASHCGGSCLLRVHVKDGVITRIETDEGDEPQIRGCFRGRAYRQRVYDPNRILHPLKRVGERGQAQFVPISWDEALSTVANEMVRIRDTYGAASIMYIPMAGDVVALHGHSLYDRLLRMFGGYTGMTGITSFGQGIFSSVATYGTFMCSNTRDDLLNSRLIILWGFDPGKCVNGPNTAYYLAKAKEQGARIIAVDPRLGDTPASVADQWITIRPSTDAAMLIAMAYVMVAENLHDRAFLDKYTVGFDRYSDYLAGKEDGVPKTPGWAEDITGVPAETIAALAREYATTKPAALLAGIAPGRTRCGEMYHRAAAVLAPDDRAMLVFTAAMPRPGPGSRCWADCPMPSWSVSAASLCPGSRRTLLRKASPWRRTSCRPTAVLTCTTTGWPTPSSRARRAATHTDYKMLFIAHCNYLNATPNINKTVEGLKRVGFVVTMEQVMTPTARYADIVLPTCTYMERNDITEVAQTFFAYGFQNKMIEPLGESRSPLDICTGLAEKLGLKNYCDMTEDQLLRAMAQRAGIPDYDKFREEGLYRLPTSEPYVAFQKQIEEPEKNPFPTPSGKIEIYSSVMAEWNNPMLPPIPKWVEPFEIPSDPLARKYPLQLTTPHGKRRANAQYERVPWLQRGRAADRVDQHRRMPSLEASGPVTRCGSSMTGGF